MWLQLNGTSILAGLRECDSNTQTESRETRFHQAGAIWNICVSRADWSNAFTCFLKRQTDRTSAYFRFLPLFYSFNRFREYFFISSCKNSMPLQTWISQHVLWKPDRVYQNSPMRHEWVNMTSIWKVFNFSVFSGIIMNQKPNNKCTSTNNRKKLKRINSHTVTRFISPFR